MIHKNKHEIAAQIVEEAKLIALKYFNNEDAMDVRAKQPMDFVSAADNAVEEFIRKRLGDVFPGEAILGEEGGGNVAQAYWTIDPIDGTANFVRGSNLWGISLAYVENQKCVAGAVCYPELGMTLSAAVGTGLIKNGKPHKRANMGSSVHIVGVGESPNSDFTELGILERNLREAKWGVAGYRCCTIAVGYTALGIIDGYIENYLSIWDIAAVSIIAQESGLNVSHTYSTEAAGLNIFVGTDELHALVQNMEDVNTALSIAS